MHCRTSAKDAKYTRICERIANFEQHIKELCESALKMRKERPLMVDISTNSSLDQFSPVFYCLVFNGWRYSPRLYRFLWSTCRQSFAQLLNK